MHLITVTILVLHASSKFQTNISILYHIKHAMGQAMVSNFTVTTCNFFVITIHFNNIVWLLLYTYKSNLYSKIRM